MVGPLKKGPGGFTHLLIAVDKFTKWIEAKPITKIRLEEAVKFFLDIIYRFGIPNYIITDHETTFTGKKFLDFSDGGPNDPLEAENDPKLIHRVHTLFLAYGAEAVLPSDIDHGVPRVKAFDRDWAMEA
ncbi:uncharacterized protein [Miscanthus floridulus]|uniref:uncharacterized protein n=1 Tax=Miscanthus floridulus TaxID=154761 RepID=UPI003458FCCC